MANNDPLYNEQEVTNAKPPLVNVKRVIARALRFWYLIVASVLAGLAISYVVNRYTTRIYPIKASIIIKENEDNLGAKFLYNNALVNPYRNHLNEVYIMKSYPLLQEVVESLHLEIAMYKEGDIKTTEYYNPDFPLQIRLDKKHKQSGRPFFIKIIDDKTFQIYYEGLDTDTKEGRQLQSLSFNDSVSVNGFRFFAAKNGDVNEFIGIPFLVSIRDPEVIAKQYSSKLKLTWAELQSSVLDLEIQGAVQKKEIDFLSKFIERYQLYDVQKKTRESKMAIAFLDRQLQVIGDSLQRYEDEVVNFKKENVTVNLQAETERLYQKMLSLEEQNFQYKLAENYNNYVITLLKQEKLNDVFTPQSVGIQDQVLSGLITELLSEQASVNLYQNNAQRGVDKTADNPALQSKMQKIAILKQDIAKAIANAKATQAINQQFIQNQINLIENQLRKIPNTERKLANIQRNFTLRESLYMFLLQKRAEAGLSEASTTSDIVVVNPPSAGGAITPKVSQNYLFGALLGFLIPVIIFIVVEILNDKVQSREDIEFMTTVPVVGGIGHNREVETLVVINKPRSSMAESFRALRSNLNYFTENKNNQVFMVTSSLPGEGKSFTSLNLASVFALAGKKTLLIGADLRKPKLYDDLGLKNDLGLSQYLSNLATLEQVIQTSEIENLDMIAGGATPPNPSELLLKPQMKELIEHLRQRYDFIVLDTPPMGLVTDAFVLADLANHILFVVRQGFTPMPVLQSLEEYHQRGKLQNISIVFNDLRKSGLGYGYGSYGYGYGYGFGYGYGYSDKRDSRSNNSYYTE
ncbi:MAG: polysaccharide biosynthesis tyrosine autokinase [Cyclobacteriaceae bacterium]|nr:polysaccharide biosynthesis tyrosine autokinase [Cyclobacteriaceae bacterium]